MNDMKNKAFDMNANYVVLEGTTAGNTVTGDANGVSGGQTDVTHTGNAYRCPTPAGTTTTTAGTPSK